MLLLDSLLSDCCFKGSSMGLKVHRNSTTNTRYLGNQGVFLLSQIYSPVLGKPGSHDSPVIGKPWSCNYLVVGKPGSRDSSIRSL